MWLPVIECRVWRSFFNENTFQLRKCGVAKCILITASITNPKFNLHGDLVRCAIRRSKDEEHNTYKKQRRIKETNVEVTHT
jgi:hypothetical protein